MKCTNSSSQRETSYIFHQERQILFLWVKIICHYQYFSTNSEAVKQFPASKAKQRAEMCAQDRLSGQQTTQHGRMRGRGSAGVAHCLSAPFSFLSLMTLSPLPARAMLGLIHRGHQRDTARRAVPSPPRWFQGRFLCRVAQPPAGIHFRPRGRLPAHPACHALGSSLNRSPSPALFQVVPRGVAP